MSLRNKIDFRIFLGDMNDENLYSSLGHHAFCQHCSRQVSGLQSSVWTLACSSFYPAATIPQVSFKRQGLLRIVVICPIT